jgi:PAS domain S-box-containing protein
MTSPSALHILILDKNSTEADLLCDVLAQANIEFEYRHAANEADYTAQLSENLDLILVGSLAAEFDASHALQLMQSRGLDIPLIIVTDTNNEAMAVTCMEQGAVDYIFNDRLLRLGPAVAKALVDKHLREELRKLHTAVEQSASSVVITDLQGNIEYINAKFTEVTGYTPGEALGKNPRILKSGETPPEVYRQLWQQLANGGEWRGEFHNRKKNGDLYWEWASISAIKDANGSVTSYLAVKEDITERKQMEERLRASEEQFRATFQYAAIGMALVSLEGQWLKVNQAVCGILGYSESELAAKTFQDITHPDDLKIHLNHSRQLVAGEVESYQMEKRYFHKHGHTIWALLSVSLVRDQQGQPLHFISQIQDITARKQAEEKLAQERDLLRTLIDSTPDYIFIKDALGRFVISNIAHAQAANAAPDELVGKTSDEVFSSDLAAQFDADDEQVLLSGEPLINLERQTTGVQGEIKTVLTSKIPLRDKNGTVVGLVGISRDITARKRLEEQTIELSAERTRLKILQRFISDMSHDFRTPLSIVNSSLYLIRKHTDPQKQQAHVEQIEHQIMRMDKILSNLLQMSQFDEQGIDLRLDLTEINTFLDPIIRAYESAAREKHLSLNFVPCDCVCFVPIDTVEFARALVALIENALLYTTAGGSVTVRTAMEGDQIVVYVQDTGIGIAAHDLPHIFERFYRADQARSAENGGNGLGLTIAQKILKAHGTTITVESAVGRGSTFSIALPCVTDEAT